MVASGDPETLQSFEKILTAQGFEIVAVSGAHECISALTKQPFDVIAVDHMLADGDGLALVPKLRSRPLDSEIVLLCVAGDLEAASHAIDAGVYDILVKPVADPILILLSVRRAYQHRQLTRDREELVRFLSDKVAELEAKNTALDESLHRLHAIEALGRELSLIQRTERAQHAIVEAVHVHLGARRVCLLLLDDENNELRVGASRGLERDEIAATRIPVPPGLSKSGRQAQRSFVTDTDDTFLSEARYNQNRYVSTPSRLEVPLTRGDTLFGVLAATDAVQPFGTKDIEFARILAAQAATALENLQMLLDMKQSYIEVIYSLVSAIEMKDSYTSGHSRRVTRYTKAIARHMGLSRTEAEIISNGALLHDVGKIGMRYEVINHPGRLSEIEFQEFRKHPTVGRTILAPGRVFRDLIPMVYMHHERFDGRGYPTGTGGEEIPMGARIVSVADAFDAMTSNRAYRRALPRDAAIEELRRCAGTQFDPQVIEVWVDALSSGKIEAFDEGSGVGTTPDASSGGGRKKRRKRKRGKSRGK